MLRRLIAHAAIQKHEKKILHTARTLPLQVVRHGAATRRRAGEAAPAREPNTRAKEGKTMKQFEVGAGRYREAAGGGVLVEGDDAVLRGGDEVVEIRRLQRRREPAGGHRRRPTDPAGRALLVRRRRGFSSPPAE